MTLKSLEILRNYDYVNLLRKDAWSLEDVLAMTCELANEIQAEVDRDYVPRRDVMYNSLIPLHISDWCMEHQGDIGDYIDHYYLPRPRFEDGEPVHIGDTAKVGRVISRVESIKYTVNGWAVNIGNKLGASAIHFPNIYGDRLKRPPEPDTQERINAQAHQIAYGLFDSELGRDELEYAILELLERQRELDNRGDA